MSDIFREIDEELRRDNFLKLWQRYGKYLIVAAGILIAATAIVAGWREYVARQAQAEGVRYEAALALAHQGKDKEAAGAFAAIAQSSEAGRAVLARLEQAALEAKAGDRDGAIALYGAVAADGSADRAYRDLATLLAARLELDKDPKAAASRVAPLTDAGNPWHASALELTALAALDQGDKTTARATYQRLADDLAAPDGARARAAEMVAALGK